MNRRESVFPVSILSDLRKITRKLPRFSVFGRVMSGAMVAASFTFLPHEVAGDGQRWQGTAKRIGGNPKSRTPGVFVSFQLTGPSGKHRSCVAVTYIKLVPIFLETFAVLLPKNWPTAESIEPQLSN